MSDLLSLVDRMRSARVLVVGDVMLDRFVYGDAQRLSPEAPVPVLTVTRSTEMLGGAGNVVRNLASLGAAAHFISLLGKDEIANRVTTLCQDLSSISTDFILDINRATSVKTRFVAGAQQLLRTDEEILLPASGSVETNLIHAIESGLQRCDVLVLSDYGKGALTDKVITEAINAAKKVGKPVLVDPKGADFIRYKGATLVTPNRKELSQASNMPTATDEESVAAALQIMSECGIESVLATRGDQGMSLVSADGTTDHIRARAREVFDVSGAGDTVIAVTAAGLAAEADLVDAVRMANAVAGIVVGKAGTAVAQSHEVREALRHEAGVVAKLATVDQLKDRVAQWRDKGLRVGFTNGCFDLLHPGHISLLGQARAGCDRLIVGLNTDASVKRLKGQERPVQDENARAAVLGGLSAVDLVVLFGEDTPIELIKACRPDVLVKGADYSEDQVVGGDFVQSYGGRILLADLIENESTTSTIAKLAR